MLYSSKPQGESIINLYWELTCLLIQDANGPCESMHD